MSFFRFVMENLEKSSDARPAGSRMATLVYAVVLASIAVGLSSRSAVAQTTQPETILTQISAAFSNGIQVGSVQLNGTIERYAGSATESGTVILTANADGTDQMQMNLSSGMRSESQTAIGVNRSCQWSGLDSVVHDSTGPTCWPALIWFLPQLSLQPGKLPVLLGTIDGGIQTTSNGTLEVLQNYVIASSFSKNSAAALQIQKLSTTLLLVDPQSMLPKALDYTLLSESGSAVISVEIRFSNYQRLAGLMLPTHIERYLNGGLELAMDISQATILN
jgi:hypothetical protein